MDPPLASGAVDMSMNGRDKIPGVLLPAEGSLRTEMVAPGLYVVVDSPYTDRFDFFESSGLHGRPSFAALAARRVVDEASASSAPSTDR
ncbi:MAG: hypothetical protein SFX72_01765 [Isosphaeraceae bacterium]|nr:hypothetical protein [Isosphaeraceae bacterium]